MGIQKSIFLFFFVPFLRPTFYCRFFRCISFSLRESIEVRTWWQVLHLRACVETRLMSVSIWRKGSTTPVSKVTSAPLPGCTLVTRPFSCGCTRRPDKPSTRVATTRSPSANIPPPSSGTLCGTDNVAHHFASKAFLVSPGGA